MLKSVVLTATLALTATAAMAEAPLKVRVYQADGASFNVTSTLISGEKEVIVIDGGFTRADALRIAANVLDSGKTLKTIFVSQADPDYYFGVETLKQFFPHAEVLTTPAVLEKIQAKVAGKVAYWGPKMGANAPKQPVLPQAYTAKSLQLEGHSIEIRGTSGILAHRPYLWIPSLRMIAGDIAVFQQMHVWTADTQSVAERQAWQAQLNEMLALKPEMVVPGHMRQGEKTDTSAILYTAEYLKRFEQEAGKAKDGNALISAMQAAYPDAVGAISLEIGARVAKGEMKW